VIVNNQLQTTVFFYICGIVKSQISETI